MYEIGDKVIYQGADKNAYKKVGVLKSIEEKDGKPQLTVEFEGGETFTAPVDDWSKEFTNACKNAKFKVGDKVTDGSGVYLVTGIDNDFGSYEWKLISGRGDSSHSEGGNFNWADSKMKIVNACISTNSVVRNAMAANRRMARNADDTYEGLKQNASKMVSLIKKLKPLTNELYNVAFSIDEMADYVKSSLGDDSQKKREIDIIARRANKVMSGLSGFNFSEY